MTGLVRGDVFLLFERLAFEDGERVAERNVLVAALRLGLTRMSSAPTSPIGTHIQNAACQP